MQNARTQRFTSVVLLSLLPGVSGVMAQQPQAPPGPPQSRSIMDASQILMAIDADHDRIITVVELDGAPAALRGLDKNGDGKLTQAEAGMRMMRGPGGPGGRGGGGGEPPQVPAPGPTAEELLSMLMSFDKNKDGKLQKAEVPERQAGLFERGDANTDGVLDSDELRKVTADQAAAPVAPPRAGRRGFARFDVAATALDKDANGEITDDEIAGATAALKVLDKNNDGRITEDEVTPPPPPAEAPRGAQL